MDTPDPEENPGIFDVLCHGSGKNIKTKVLLKEIHYMEYGSFANTIKVKLYYENNIPKIMVTPNNDLHSMNKPPLTQSLLSLPFVNT